MDYKVHIDAGKEDCYFQYVQPGATFYASYQVIITPFLEHVSLCIYQYFTFIYYVIVINKSFISINYS